MKKSIWIVLLMLLLSIISCLPLNASAPQPAAPNIETIVAATQAASVIETEAAKPPATATPVNTATPSRTPVPPTITPTFTPTFIYILSTATPVPTNTPVNTSTPAVTATPTNFECKLVSQTPANGTSMGSRNDFDWLWTVTNTGKNDWLAADVDYLYIEGTEFHKKAVYDLPSDVPTGKDVKLGVDMVALKNPGSYTTTWALRKGSKTFCTVTLKITVK